MKRSLAVTAFLSLSIGGCLPAFAQTFTTASLLQELDRVRHSIETNDNSVLKALPPAWQVQTSEHSYSISTEPLRSLDKNDKRAVLSIEWLTSLEAQVRSNAAQAGQSIDDPRETLNRILARSEFAAVAPPSAWDLFAQRFSAAIGRLIEHLFFYVAQHPTGSAVVFWTVLSLTVVGLGLWLLQLLQRRGISRTVPQQTVFGEPIRPWKDWLAAAKQASEQGNYKEAFHSGYWAAVLRLQQTGALPVELTNTPRERLRLMGRANLHEPLSNVTKALERFWYAGQAARKEDVHTLFEQLEAMECKGD